MKTALVVGGRGNMGRWFARFFASEGWRVLTSDPRGPLPGFEHVDDWLAAAGAADLVLFATPLDATAPLLRRVRGRTDALVLEIASLKTPVAKELRALSAAGHRVASLHPMWGPDTDLLSDKSLLVLDCGSKAGVRAAKALFRRTAVTIREVPLARHDELMAWSLGLPHAANLLFTEAVSASGKAPTDLLPLGGPTFRNQVATAKAVSRENEDLYYLIQAKNPHTPRVLAQLRRSLDMLRAAVGSRRKFRTLMKRGRAWHRKGAAANGRRKRT